MEWLNYHHLLYFWTVAKEGGVTKACRRLRLAQPTVSGQLRAFEEALGEKLFAKAGRGLTLTDTGRLVYQYADEIFAIGNELQNVLKGRSPGRPLRLLAGVPDMMPKLIAYRILEPALSIGEPVQLVCQEDSPERLLAELAEHRLHVVLSDVPITAMTRVKAFNHPLGASGVTIFAERDLAARYREGFPESLDGAPFLLPVQGSGLRRSLDLWMHRHEIRPVVAGEFKDSALMKSFGQAGAGVFAAPAAIEKEIQANYRTVPLGPAAGVTENYYAISVERKVRHAAVAAICDAARNRFFSTSKNIENTDI
ncbi:MAG: transcriptional activator NhaR [Bryobacteraceae bacterium]|nr:transcriptional activator NhaR [Bryobacteraceae bacterium]